MLAHEEGRVEDLFLNKSNDELVRKMPCSIMLVKKEPGPFVGLIRGWGQRKRKAVLKFPEAA